MEFRIVGRIAEVEVIAKRHRHPKKKEALEVVRQGALEETQGNCDS